MVKLPVFDNQSGISFEIEAFMHLFGFIKWRGRTHVEYSQLWRKATLPVEVIPSPPRWLLRRRLLKNWKIALSRGLFLWEMNEGDKDAILKRVSDALVARGEAFEIEP